MVYGPLEPPTKGLAVTLGHYSYDMTHTRSDLPERMTWEELEQLPKEVASEIELWEGRVVVVRHAPREHQEATGVLWSALRSVLAKREQADESPCLRASMETNVFLGKSAKSDFLTPDFLVHRCVPEFSDIRGSDVVIAGEVLSRSNTPGNIEARKARYASAGIPWYWEVTLAADPARVASIRIYGLESGYGELPSGVHPLRPANYLLVKESDSGGIAFDYPFEIRVLWEQLQI